MMRLSLLFQKKEWRNSEIAPRYLVIDLSKEQILMLVFFVLNGIELRYTQKELYEMVLAVADGSLEYEDMLKWILEHQA